MYVFLVFSLYLFSICKGECEIDVKFPSIILSGVPFHFTVVIPPFVNSTQAIPLYISLTLYENDTELYSLHNVSTRDNDGKDNLTKISGLAPVNHSLHIGHHHLKVELTDESGDLLCEPNEQRLLSIPAWLTIFPPIITAFVAIIFRQIFLALVFGIWLAAFLGHGYDPFAAILRTLDTYIVDAIVDHDHSAIVIATFFLGGLIGIVQRSGGGLGLAKCFSHFANSPRKACLVCFFVALFIFFDDYTCVLITGNSLRLIMDTAGVSKNKFAFILQNMGPSVASFFPISSWVGAQVGYVNSGFMSCGKHQQPFNIVVQTLPYRFLPILMIFCVFFVCILNRDFGCMLTAERTNLRLISRTRTNYNSDDEEEEGLLNQERVELHGTSDASELDDNLFEGPLAPKRGVPHRWFNAVVPFTIVIIVTFASMMLDGWRYIVNNNVGTSHNDSTYIRMTATNIFGTADAIAALIWSSVLATTILVIMLAIQRILSMKEVMESWIEGVKDVIEPLIILLLAWALGSVISEIQTSNFIAQALNGGNLPTKYIPAITTIIGYFMAYATGSAFGTMGILFPIVIPTVCKLGGDESIKIQTAAAILSSSIFGNLMSPIADITVLTRVSTRCDLNSHLKSCSLYVLIVGFITVIFGALPVGAGWYPWWAAWIIMPSILVIIFVLFSSGHNSDSIYSRSLCRMGCPCVFVALDRIYFQLAMRLNVFKIKYGSRFHHCCRCVLKGSRNGSVQKDIIEDDFQTANTMNDGPSDDGNSYYSS